jgi:large subunit ribosomal protein L5
MVKRLIEAKDKQLKLNNFDEHGTVSFGIPECIDIPGVEYDPAIGIIGLQATITLARPGFRVKRRRNLRRKLPEVHTIHKEESIAFMQSAYGVELPSDEDEE